MTNLRIGDYHLAEVHRSLRPEGGTASWFAHCNGCGWSGPLRASLAAAQDDCLTHDVTENERRQSEGGRRDRCRPT
jgi:hypothetical protein